MSAADFGLARSPPASAAPKKLADTKKSSATGGSFVAFYASQSDEISLELAVPRGAPPEQQSWVSAFTDAMIGVLRARPQVATYRDLLDETARSMRAQIPPRTRQTPGHDGDALDRPLLGGALPARIAGFSVENNRIAGGLIAGLEPGTVLALFDRAGGAPLAHAQVTQADALGAEIVPVAFPCTLKRRRAGVRAQRRRATCCRRRGIATVVAAGHPHDACASRARATGRTVPPRPRARRSRPPALALIGETAGYLIDDAKPDFIWYRTPDGRALHAVLDAARRRRVRPRRRRSTRATPRKPPAASSRRSTAPGC